MELKKAKMTCFGILGIFLILMLIMGVTSNPAFGYAALGVMAIYGVFIMIVWRCPKCGKNLGPLWVKCCPNCGEKIS